MRTPTISLVSPACKRQTRVHSASRLCQPSTSRRSAADRVFHPRLNPSRTPLSTDALAVRPPAAVNARLPLTPGPTSATLPVPPNIWPANAARWNSLALSAENNLSPTLYCFCRSFGRDRSAKLRVPLPAAAPVDGQKTWRSRVGGLAVYRRPNVLQVVTLNAELNVSTVVYIHRHLWTDAFKRVRVHAA